jgi:Ca2+-binding RTX toxin-like protein
LIQRDIAVKFAFTGDASYGLQIGTSQSDRLLGSPAWDQLFGRDGNDQLLGKGGDDILQGDAGDDSLCGGLGSDRLDGGGGADQVSGGDMEDELVGGDGADSIDGGAGHDMLEGGMGNDTIRGGTGADAFLVMPDSGHDTVRDFEAGGAAQGAFDHIAFIDILSDQVTVGDTHGGARIAWDSNGDGAADGSVLLQGVSTTALRQSDFMFNQAPAFIVGISTAGSDHVF